MDEPRVVRETIEYEDGTVEERVVRRKEEPREYEAPGPSWLMPLGLLVVGGLAIYMLYLNKDKLFPAARAVAPAARSSVGPGEELDPGETSSTAPGGYSTPPTVYAAETPRPMVNVDEFVGLVERSGRLIG